jgi:hypothetical protein
MALLKAAVQTTPTAAGIGSTKQRNVPDTPSKLLDRDEAKAHAESISDRS